MYFVWGAFWTIEENLPLVHVGFGTKRYLHAVERVFLKLAVFLNPNISRVVFRVDLVRLLPSRFSSARSP